MKLLSLSLNGTPIEVPSGIPTGGTNALGSIIQFVVQTTAVIAILIGLGMIIFAGIKWIMSQGDKQKIESSRDTIVWTIVGLVVIFLSFLIVNLIGFFFGVKYFRN